MDKKIKREIEFLINLMEKIQEIYRDTSNVNIQSAVYDFLKNKKDDLELIKYQYVYDTIISQGRYITEFSKKEYFGELQGMKMVLKIELMESGK